MPKFKITYHKTRYHASYPKIIEAKDEEQAESIAESIDLDEWNYLEWDDGTDEEPDWDNIGVRVVDSVEEVTDD